MSGITRDMWLKAIGDIEVLQDDPNALTAAEFGETILGKSASSARVTLKRLVREGKVERVTKIVVDQAGRRLPVPAYRPVA